MQRTKETQGSELGSKLQKLSAIPNCILLFKILLFKITAGNSEFLTIRSDLKYCGGYFLATFRLSHRDERKRTDPGV